MADENTVYVISLESSEVTGGEIRLFTLGLETSEVTPGDVQINTIALETSEVTPGDVRIFNISIEVSRTISDTQLFKPVFVDEDVATPPVSSIASYVPGEMRFRPIAVLENEVNDVYSLTSLDLPGIVVSKVAERNPYGAHIPSHTEDYSAFFAEQQRVLREQHNITQAGDSTFDWGLLIEVNKTQLYTLGALGRFWHESLGIILARYVKFKDMIKPNAYGYPVGQHNESLQVDWVVTSDLSLSDPDWVMGVFCGGQPPADGDYGWIVIEGGVPVLMVAEDATVPNQNDPYFWTSSGRVGLNAAGRIMGRRYGHGPNENLTSGFFYVSIEGPGITDLVTLVSAEISDILADAVTLTARVDVLEAQDVIHSANILSLQTTQANIQASLNAEISLRSSQIAALQAQIAAIPDWQSTIDDAVTNLTNAYIAADDVINVTINALDYRVQQIETAIAGFDFASIQPQIDNLVAVLGQLKRNWWTVTATGTGASQNITLPESVYTVDDVIVIVNGLVWAPSEYSIVTDTLTITSNANGDSIVVRGIASGI